MANQSPIVAPDRNAGIVTRYLLIGLAFGLTVVAGRETSHSWEQALGLSPLQFNQQSNFDATTDPEGFSSENLPIDGLVDRSLLRYEHFPRILTPAETGTIRVVAEVVGDLHTLVFRRNRPSGVNGYREELWTRTNSTAVNGRLISIFEKQF